MSVDAGVVRFTVSADVAFNPKAFGKLIRDISEKLGCRPCFSGVDCLFQLQRDWVIDAKAKALPTDPVPWRGAAKPVQVVMPAETSRNIDSLAKISDAVFGKLGCLPCTTGFDVLFRNEIRTLGFDKKLNLQEFGG